MGVDELANGVVEEKKAEALALGNNQIREYKKGKSVLKRRKRTK